MFWTDLSSYLQGQMGAALVAGFPGIIAPLFFRRSRLVSVLSGAIAANILPIGMVYYGALAGGPEDAAALMALTTLLGAGAGLLLYTIGGRQKRPR